MVMDKAAGLGGEDFLVIALSIARTGIESVKDFYRDVGVEKLAIYLDRSGKGTHDLAMPGIPTTLLLDREGREVAHAPRSRPFVKSRTRG